MHLASVTPGPSALLDLCLYSSAYASGQLVKRDVSHRKKDTGKSRHQQTMEIHNSGNYIYVYVTSKTTKNL